MCDKYYGFLILFKYLDYPAYIQSLVIYIGRTNSNSADALLSQNYNFPIDVNCCMKFISTSGHPRKLRICK